MSPGLPADGRALGRVRARRRVRQPQVYGGVRVYAGALGRAHVYVHRVPPGVRSCLRQGQRYLSQVKKRRKKICQFFRIWLFLPDLDIAGYPPFFWFKDRKNRDEISVKF